MLVQLSDLSKYIKSEADLEVHQTTAQFLLSYTGVRCTLNPPPKVTDSITYI